jgi:hypothetical protein
MGTAVAAKEGAKYYAMRDGGGTVFETRDYMYTRLDKQQRDFEAGGTTTTLAPAGGEPEDDGDGEPLGDETSDEASARRTRVRRPTAGR